MKEDLSQARVAFDKAVMDEYIERDFSWDNALPATTSPADFLRLRDDIDLGLQSSLDRLEEANLPF